MPSARATPEEHNASNRTAAVGLYVCTRCNSSLARARSSQFLRAIILQQRSRVSPDACALRLEQQLFSPLTCHWPCPSQLSRTYAVLVFPSVIYGALLSRGSLRLVPLFLFPRTASACWAFYSSLARITMRPAERIILIIQGVLSRGAVGDFERLYFDDCSDFIRRWFIRMMRLIGWLFV